MTQYTYKVTLMLPQFKTVLDVYSCMWCFDENFCHTVSMGESVFTASLHFTFVKSTTCYAESNAVVVGRILPNNASVVLGSTASNCCLFQTYFASIFCLAFFHWARRSWPSNLPLYLVGYSGSFVVIG